VTETPRARTGDNDQRPTVIAAIPCFNEERSIGSIVLKTKRYVDKVIVIDDSSTDDTAQVASDAGAIVCQHGCNLGYGAALQTAFLEARKLGVDVMLTLDGDGQHKPSDIPQLLSPILNGEADVVIGSRFLGQAEKPPLYRRLGQRILTTATNLGSRQMVSDSQSGFRAYSSKAIKEINPTENGMSAGSEILLILNESKLRVVDVPIDVSYHDKAKRNPLAHGINVISRIFVLSSLRHPLLLFGLPGLCLVGGGLALGARVLTIYSETRDLALGNALGAVLFLVSGLLALFAALMLQSMKELLRQEWKQIQDTESSMHHHRTPNHTER